MCQSATPSSNLIVTAVPFDVKDFLSEEWKLVFEDHDSLKDGLKSVDFSKVKLVSCLKQGEIRITCEEKFERLKAGNKIRLGADVFLGLWRDWEALKENSVLETLFRTQNITYLDFFGDVLLDPSGSRCVLILRRDSSGQWGWSCGGLDHFRYARQVSAVLPIV
ncbi:MAG: hypothetical protein AAB534_02130 [Patescibacteria group bacterium]